MQETQHERYEARYSTESVDRAAKGQQPGSACVGQQWSRSSLVASLL